MDPGSSDSDRHHYFVAQSGASVELEALVDGLNGWWEFGPRIRIGEVVTRSFVVTNTGTVPLTNVQVSDDLIGRRHLPQDHGSARRDPVVRRHPVHRHGQGDHLRPRDGRRRRHHGAARTSASPGTSR